MPPSVIRKLRKIVHLLVVISLARLCTKISLLSQFAGCSSATHSNATNRGTALHQPYLYTAWYAKPFPTFADTLAVVRHLLWFHPLTFRMSPSPPDLVKVPRPLFDLLVNSLCYAA